MNLLKLVVTCVAIAIAAFVVYRLYEQRETARLNNEAATLVGQGQYAQAVERLQAAQRNDPDNPTIWKNLGTAYEELDDPRRAIEAYERSLALWADQPALRTRLEALKKIAAHRAPAP